MKRCFLLLAGIMILSPSLLCQPNAFSTERLDSFVSKAMNDWHLMGVAVAVIKKDSVILAKGYGYRDYMNRLPVTENTTYPIASCSKTFTTALLGMAEKEGKIELNKPVHHFLPQFRLYNEQLTLQVTAEDMLSHRTGVAAHDWAWAFNTNFTGDVYLKRLKYLEPFAPLRTQYQYNNFMFFGLSVLAGKLYNTTWNDLVEKKLFRPLEMNNTYSNYVSRNDHYANAALKYEFRDTFQLKPTNQMDDLLGAGAINSTARDVAHWLQMWINGGRYKNKQLLQPDFIKRAIQSHFVVAGEMNHQYPDEQFNNIGLCWFLSSYRGHYEAHHTGNLDGFSSSISFFPYDSLGIVVLTNQNSSVLIKLIPEFVADLVFHVPVRDKNDDFIALRKKYDSAEASPAMINADTIKSKSFFSMQSYPGHFQNPGYGEIRIEATGKTLLLTYYALKLALIPKDGHSFPSHFVDSDGISPDGVGDVRFKVDKKGIVQSFEIPLEPTV